MCMPHNDTWAERETKAEQKPNRAPSNIKAIFPNIHTNTLGKENGVEEGRRV